MSSYEDYSQTSQSYDDTRMAVGIEIILGALATVGRPLAELTLLDAGCGTGSYSAALIDQVGRIVGVDANREMLRQASAKLGLAIARGQVSLHPAGIDSLPLAESSVDAVMVNQVLHHLGDDAASGWASTRRVVQELARVTRPGGVLTINTCSHEQLRHGWWYVSLMPGTAQDMCERHVPLDELGGMLRASGFDLRARYVPVDAVLQGAHYRDGLGPTREAWRRGDSAWARVKPEELERINTRLLDLHAAGELEAFVQGLDARRQHIGQVTFLVATRAE